MSLPDLRWIQRFQNFRKAFGRLTEAEALSKQRTLSDLEQQGLVQAFEFTHELGWNVLKDYLEEQGFVGLVGSKNATREAFRNGLVLDGAAWMDMIKARNLTSHTYNCEVVEGIVRDTLARFYPAFADLEKRFTALEQEAGKAP